MDKRVNRNRFASAWRAKGKCGRLAEAYYFAAKFTPQSEEKQDLIYALEALRSIFLAQGLRDLMSSAYYNAYQGYFFSEAWDAKLITASLCFACCKIETWQSFTDKFVELVGQFSKIRGCTQAPERIAAQVREELKQAGISNSVEFGSIAKTCRQTL
jgi:hypothetical protein